MDEVTVNQKIDVGNLRAVKNDYLDKQTLLDEDPNNPVFNNLVAEGGGNFYHYINWLGLSKDPNLMILSSIHHYYYDFNELKDVRTLVNLKQLNQINHIDRFLSNVLNNAF